MFWVRKFYTSFVSDELQFLAIIHLLNVSKAINICCLVFYLVSEGNWFDFLVQVDFLESNAISTEYSFFTVITPGKKKNTFPPILLFLECVVELVALFVSSDDVLVELYFNFGVFFRGDVSVYFSITLLFSDWLLRFDWMFLIASL